MADDGAREFYVQPTLFVNGGAFYFAIDALLTETEHFTGEVLASGKLTLDLKLVKLSAGDTAAQCHLVRCIYDFPV